MPRARSEHAVLEGQPDGAVAVLGRRAHLGQPDQHAQPDVRREGAGLVHLAGPPAGESGLLQEGLGPSVGEDCSRSSGPTAISRCTIRRPGKFTLISTCFPTHHLIFAEDANNTLWTSAGGPQSGVIGWLNRKMFEETGDEEKSQGWTALVLDTNGNGKRDDVRRAQPAGRSDQGQACQRRGVSTASP